MEVWMFWTGYFVIMVFMFFIMLVGSYKDGYVSDSDKMGIFWASLLWPVMMPFFLLYLICTSVDKTAKRIGYAMREKKDEK